MRIDYLFGLLFLAVFAIACGDTTTNEEADDSMGQFADDEEFQGAHDEPDAITFEGIGEMQTFDTPDGEQGSAYVIQAEGGTAEQVLFVIHEWWGLNNHIKREAERLYEELPNTTVMALDLYDGKVATSQEQAGEFMQAVSDERAEAIIKGAIAQTGTTPIGTIGWCFGGGWSLKASILAGEQGVACVMYYGMPVQSADKLQSLEAPVLGIFAEQDGWITPEVANKFKNMMQATGKEVEIRSFDANHAFANPSSEAYKEQAAQEANQLARNFLKERLIQDTQ